MKTIDVGCGLAWEGDVNVDVKKPCEVLADCFFLPFKKGSFKKAILHHVIEHLENPEKALDEILRVADFVEVVVPAGWHPYSHIDKSHKHFFNSEWFKQYAEERGLRVRGIQRFDGKRSFYYFGVELCVWLLNGEHNE